MTSAIFYYDILDTELGDIAIVASDTAIVEISFQNGKVAVDTEQDNLIQTNTGPTHLQSARQQLKEYFAGLRKTFDLPLQQDGTAFQKKIWQALTDIRFGSTQSYLGLAKAINNPAAVRAVGAANGANKIAIVVPCHRVIGSDKKLTGYAGGIGIKAKLLMLEGAHFKV